MRRIAILASLLLFALVVSAAPASGKARGPHYYRTATIYGQPPCDSNVPSWHAADGTYLGGQDPPRTVASNVLPRGALLRFDRLLFGHRYFRVRDTGGRGAALFDVFHPCPLPSWGNPTLGFRLVRPRR